MAHAFTILTGWLGFLFTEITSLPARNRKNPSWITTTCSIRVSEHMQRSLKGVWDNRTTTQQSVRKTKNLNFPG